MKTWRRRFVTVLAGSLVTLSMVAVPNYLTRDLEEVMENLPYIVPQDEEHGELRIITAYTSRISETDGSPCISANGTNICEVWQDGKNVCAANFVPFGTRLNIEGVGVCVVMDRMNSRFSEYVDWYFGYDTQEAIEFGVKVREVMILENAIWTDAN